MPKADVYKLTEINGGDIDQELLSIEIEISDNQDAKEIELDQANEVYPVLMQITASYPETTEEPEMQINFSLSYEKVEKLYSILRDIQSGYKIKEK